MYDRFMSTRYEIKVKTRSGILYTFTADVDRNPNFIRITLGSSRRQASCVDIFIEQATGSLSVLEDFVYDKACAQSNDLRNGPDGSIIMLLTTLHVVYQAFPTIRMTELSDKSYIGRTSLIHYYLLKSGNTWYQKWFNAIPSYSQERRNLMLFREKINKIVNITYESFISESHMPETSQLKQIYVSALNKIRWRSLFEKLSNESSMKRAFMLAIPHICRMLELPNMIATSWTMKRSDIERHMAYSMTVLSMRETRGGSESRQHEGGSQSAKLNDVVYMYGGRSMRYLRYGEP